MFAFVVKGIAPIVLENLTELYFLFSFFRSIYIDIFSVVEGRIAHFHGGSLLSKGFHTKIRFRLFR